MLDGLPVSGLTILLIAVFVLLAVRLFQVGSAAAKIDAEKRKEESERP